MFLGMKKRQMKDAENVPFETIQGRGAPSQQHSSSRSCFFFSFFLLSRGTYVSITMALWVGGVWVNRDTENYVGTGGRGGR